MENCNNGINIPQTTDEPCGGVYTATNCIATPNAIPYLDLAAGATQTQINAALVSSLSFKDEQIAEIPVSDGTETKIIAGENVTVTGTGTTLDPYTVGATSGVGVAQDLQSVLTQGNTTTESITSDQVISAQAFNVLGGTYSFFGSNQGYYPGGKSMMLADNKISIHSGTSTSGLAQFSTSLITSNKTYSFPDKSGTLATVSDLESIADSRPYKSIVFLLDSVADSAPNLIILENQTDFNLTVVYNMVGSVYLDVLSPDLARDYWPMNKSTFSCNILGSVATSLERDSNKRVVVRSFDYVNNAPSDWGLFFTSFEIRIYN